jgi:hypothetical protein
MFIQDPETLMKSYNLNFEYSAKKKYGVDCGKLTYAVSELGGNTQPSWASVTNSTLMLDLSRIAVPFTTKVLVRAS